MYKDYDPGHAPAKMEELAEHIRTADGFVVVRESITIPIQPGLSNLMDHYLEEYFFRPAGIVSSRLVALGEYGQPYSYVLFCQRLECSISSIFAISKIGESLDEAGTSQAIALTKRVGQFLDELEWYEEALQRQRFEKETLSNQVGISIERQL